MTKPVSQLYEFDGVRVDVRKRRLLRGDAVVPLTPKAFETLLVLLARHGEVLDKDDLMKAVWPDTIVEESALSRNIYLIRKALGEGPDDHRYIVTVPGRGYSFVGHVDEPGPGISADGSDAEPQGALHAEEVVMATRTVTSIVTEEEIGEVDAPAVAAAKRRGIGSALVAVSIVLVLAVIAGMWAMGPARDDPGAPVRSLAVLPFHPLASGSGDEYLGLGMTDALITRLNRVGAILVRPTSAVLRYADRGRDALAAGRALRVDAVLEGTIQRDGERVRVTARLIDVSTGRSLWAEQIDQTFTDLFDVEDVLSTKLAEGLAITLTSEEQRRLTAHDTSNREAFHAYLQGRYFLSQWTRPSLEKAVEAFGRAIDADPEYALAHSGLADAHVLQGYLGMVSPGEAFPKSEAAALAALRLDESSSEAHLSLAKTRFFYSWDWPDAERGIRRALALNPNYADAHGFYGAYLTAIGQFDEALAERRCALDLDPASPLTMTMVGWVHFYDRQHDLAIEWYRKALELDANFAQAYMDLGQALYQTGRYDEAVAAFVTEQTILNPGSERASSIKAAYAAAGIRGYWRNERELSEKALGLGRHVAPWRLARICSELGDTNCAFNWLDQAVKERTSMLVFLKTTPIFDRLHADPRFDALVRRIGLP